MSKLERVKANSIEKSKITNNINFLQSDLNILARFAFTRFSFRVLADPKEIIRRLKRNVILRNAIEVSGVVAFFKKIFFKRNKIAVADCVSHSLHKIYIVMYIMNCI